MKNCCNHDCNQGLNCPVKPSVSSNVKQSIADFLWALFLVLSVGILVLAMVPVIYFRYIV